MLLQIQDGTLSVGGQTLLAHFDFEIKGNEKIAIVGPNGCGKTSFLRLLSGELDLDRDDHCRTPGLRTSRALTVEMLRQNAFSDTSLTVEQLLTDACPCKDRWDLERFSWETEYDRIFTGFGFDKFDRGKRLSEFSGGEQTKIALIRLLLLQPDILLLDEPTNHLDMESVEWLEEYLQSYPKAFVVVSHDRFFLDRTAAVIYDFREQRMFRYAGNYSSFRDQRTKELALRRKEYERQQAEIRREEELIERFRHKPNKASFIRSRKKLLERMPRIEKPAEDRVHNFTEAIDPQMRSAKWVLEAEKLKIGYEHALLEINLRIRRGQKIGVIGPNGAGKSTFLKTAAGLLPPINGSLLLGQNVLIGYFDQQSAALRSDLSVIEHFQQCFPSMTDKDARSALGAFLFSGRETAKKVSVLSGGEKSRLVLAELFTGRPNFFILDEPTNHMDIPARETLESAFRAYTGTLLFVSHDRYFIREVAQSLLIFENQDVYYYPFDYEHYLAHCRKESGAELSAALRAEDQALLSGLKSVPKKERHESHPLTTEQAYEDWQLRLAEAPLGEIRAQLAELWEGRDLLQEWTDPACAREWNAREADLNSIYTERCLAWYEKWAEFHPNP
ncbi:MAG: ATP-binding cassette domain-containing protein [Lachnospiraceae bacterium]|nr:ATP-binding cassette domain-containing protein [Lachnospiraceae bacterium]